VKKGEIPKGGEKSFLVRSKPTTRKRMGMQKRRTRLRDEGLIVEEIKRGGELQACQSRLFLGNLHFGRGERKKHRYSSLGSHTAKSRRAEKNLMVDHGRGKNIKKILDGEHSTER